MVSFFLLRKYFEILHIHTFFGKYQVERFFFLSSGVAFTEWFPGFDKKALAFKILLTQLNVLWHDFCKKSCRPSHRNFFLPCCPYTACSWSIENDSCCLEPPPSGHQLLLGTHKICILWWRAHSNLLHSREARLQDKTES